MALVKRFQDLEAWRVARQLTNLVYDLTGTDSFRRDYGLADQIRRASVSVMNNIAEGFDSGSPAEFIQFLGYAWRSASEVQSCLYLALDRRYCSQESFRRLYDETECCRGLMGGLFRYLRNGRQRQRLYVSTSAHPHTRT